MLNLIVNSTDAMLFLKLIFPVVTPKNFLKPWADDGGEENADSRQGSK